jgi:hypothetical protein
MTNTTEHKWTTATGANVTLAVETHTNPERDNGDGGLVAAEAHKTCRLTLQGTKIDGTYGVGAPRYNTEAGAEVFEVREYRTRRMLGLVKAPADVVDAVWGAERRIAAEKARRADEYYRQDREFLRRHDR